jgi:hypothetical protein
VPFAEEGDALGRVLAVGDKDLRVEGPRAHLGVGGDGNGAGKMAGSRQVGESYIVGAQSALPFDRVGAQRGIRPARFEVDKPKPGAAAK